MFHDRLVNLEDKTYFYYLLREICQKMFGTPVIQLPDSGLLREPPLLLFGDFMSQAAKEDRPYDEIKDIEKLKGILQVWKRDFSGSVLSNIKYFKTCISQPNQALGWAG